MDIENILRTNPGLMIELKHWVAREATEQGQLISESDLSDLTIRERLHEDTKFRAVATQLLQRYGYLTPKVDPESQMGHENELVLEERSKLIAQEHGAARFARAIRRSFERAFQRNSSGAAARFAASKAAGLRSSGTAKRRLSRNDIESSTGG